MPTTPLRARHEALGARFTDFAGWEMPLSYEGVVAEHMAVRESAGVFDVSHLGRFSVTGDAGRAVARHLLCNDLAAIEPGRAQYTMALNDNGGVEDDIIVWLFEDEAYWVMPNGTNFHEIVGRFLEAGEDGIAVDPIRDDTVMLAVQGPEARRMVEEVIGVVPGRFRVATAEFDGGPVWLAGTGYTGEPGAEIVVPADGGAALLDALVDAGARPCGLGARDTLRLEMGFPLWGQDLGPDTTPLEAGLGWVVRWTRDFVGRPALERQREEGMHKSLTGFVMQDRRPPRPGYALRSGSFTGSVASGNFSPVLGRGIGMGYLSPPPEGDTLEVEMRGTWYQADIVSPPFIER